ncbi:hypothetical protein Pst134EA_019045 [Puccinia striiformis f. sp. tritici]|uniref:hypothetical protein n=1 Tax=Puccinia striiformis f. sp. tritici TaxID=168172 RepID=UPI002007F5BD|nr:hypothetical protein Pst134EA_019045 [Puccinia striiformis f. sp. tritici]KAH9458891.1 hypothetical protein Pst134EA_019045 [Puccinia striiformis f. sp. tritici]
MIVRIGLSLIPHDKQYAQSSSEIDRPVPIQGLTIANFRVKVADVMPQNSSAVNLLRLRSTSEAQPVVSLRTAFSKRDQEQLAWFLAKSPGDRFGNAIYREFARTHTNHTWQAWQDHYQSNSLVMNAVIKRKKNQQQAIKLPRKQNCHRNTGSITINDEIELTGWRDPSFKKYKGKEKAEIEVIEIEDLEEPDVSEQTCSSKKHSIAPRDFILHRIYTKNSSNENHLSFSHHSDKPYWNPRVRLAPGDIRFSSIPYEKYHLTAPEFSPDEYRQHYLAKQSKQNTERGAVPSNEDHMQVGPASSSMTDERTAIDTTTASIDDQVDRNERSSLSISPIIEASDNQPQFNSSITRSSVTKIHSSTSSDNREIVDTNSNVIRQANLSLPLNLTEDLGSTQTKDIQPPDILSKLSGNSSDLRQSNSLPSGLQEQQELDLVSVQARTVDPAKNLSQLSDNRVFLASASDVHLQPDLQTHSTASNNREHLVTPSIEDNLHQSSHQRVSHRFSTHARDSDPDTKVLDNRDTLVHDLRQERSSLQSDLPKETETQKVSNPSAEILVTILDNQDLVFTSLDDHRRDHLLLSELRRETDSVDIKDIDPPEIFSFLLVSDHLLNCSHDPRDLHEAADSTRTKPIDYPQIDITVSETIFDTSSADVRREKVVLKSDPGQQDGPGLNPSQPSDPPNILSMGPVDLVSSDLQIELGLEDVFEPLLHPHIVNASHIPQHLLDSLVKLQDRNLFQSF